MNIWNLLFDLLKAGVVAALLMVLFALFSVWFWRAKYDEKEEFRTNAHIVHPGEPGRFFIWSKDGIQLREVITFFADQEDGTIVIRTEDGRELRIKTNDWILADVPVGLEDHVDE